MGIMYNNKNIKTRPPAGRQGFTLLIAVIFMSVMLVFGLSIGSIAYKQKILSSVVTNSMYAFYAADAALECVLYVAQKTALLSYPTSNPSPPTITCGGANQIELNQIAYTASRWALRYRFKIDGAAQTTYANERCADVTVYSASPGNTTYIFSQGYNVGCDDIGKPFVVTRGLSVHY